MTLQLESDTTTTKALDSSFSPTVSLVELPDFSVKYTLKGHSKAISVVKISPDGKWIASGSADTTIKLWSAIDGQFELSFQGHTQGVNDVTWTRDSLYLASGSDDHQIHLWSMASLQTSPIRTLVGHTSFVFCVHFNHQSNLLISGSFDETVRVWDTLTGNCLKVIPAHADPVSCVQFVRDGSFFASGSYDGLIRLWDTKSGHCLKTFVLNDNASIGGMVFSPNGQYILASTLDSTLYIWDVYEGKIEQVFRGHTNQQYCLFSTWIMSKKNRFRKHTSPHHSTKKSNGVENNDPQPKVTVKQPPYNDFVVCGSEDGQLHMWELQSSNLVARIPAHSAPIIAVDYSSVNDILVTGAIDPDRSIKIWTRQFKSNQDEEVESKEPQLNDSLNLNLSSSTLSSETSPISTDPSTSNCITETNDPLPTTEPTLESTMLEHSVLNEAATTALESIEEETQKKVDLISLTTKETTQPMDISMVETDFLS